MAQAIKEYVTDSRGGRGRKRDPELKKRDGTYRPTRGEAPWDPDDPILFPKPQKPLPPSKRKAARKWIQCEADEYAVSQGCWFDERFAQHAREFGVKYLKHWEGRWHGQPFELLDWQYDHVIGPLFGWMQEDPHVGPIRRIRRMYVEIPKKNGKSPLGAYVGSYMLVGDGEFGAKVFSAATTLKQAGVVHDHAIRFVDASLELNARSKINRSSGVIHYKPTDSYYRTVASESGGVEGLNGNCCIIDELHAWPRRDLWTTLRWMFASRDQPILFAITTAGIDFNGVCRQQHDYWKAVKSNHIKDPGYYGYIAAAPADADVSDPNVWQEANPSWGPIIRESEFQENYNESLNNPQQLAAFCRYRLNIWSPTDCPGVDLQKWELCGDTIEPEDLLGKRCTIGLDLARTQDLTCACYAFFDSEADLITIKPRFFLPEDRAKELRENVPFKEWEANGWITLTSGNVCDYGYIEKQLIDDLDEYQIDEIVYDQRFAEDVTQRLENAGIPRRVFPQTMQHFSGPSEEFRRRVIGAKLRHDNNPILNWQIGHFTWKEDANKNKRPYKERHGDWRTIDGVVATVMAIGGIMHAKEEGRFYDGEGIYL